MSGGQWLDLGKTRVAFESLARSKGGKSCHDVVLATHGEFLWMFSRWLGLRPCWRSCRWWVRRCQPGSRGLRCRRSALCGSSARTPPRWPPDTCDWLSARRSRHCAMTGRGRATTEREVLIPYVLYILWMTHLLLFNPTRQCFPVVRQKHRHSSNTLKMVNNYYPKVVLQCFLLLND